jgi:rare lipoprotein A
MRRAVSVVIVTCTLLLPATVAGAAPVDGDPVAARAALLLRIADLTDRLDDAQVAVVRAQTAQHSSQAALRGARRRLRDRAIAAYTYGALAPDAASARSTAYLAVALRKERVVLRRAVDARGDADEARGAAENARGDLRQASAALEATRAELDRRVAVLEARRAAEERRADEARRAANAQRAAADAAGRARGLLPRHRAATARQLELLGRYPFGPLHGALPAGLRATGQTLAGKASWYGPGFDGRATASGAIYDMEGWTCASRDHPLGTLLVVTRGDKQVLLLVNDRGPYVDDRILDLTHAAASYLNVGVTPVTAEIVVPA